LEAGGSRVIAIPYAANETTLTHLFNSINGLLFTGGSINIDIHVPLPQRNETYNLYTKNAAFMIDLAMKANDRGDYFPIWGTC